MFLGFNALCDSVEGRYLKILAMDPGLVNKGMSLLKLDLETGMVLVVASGSLNSNTRLKEYRHLSEISGERFSRVLIQQENLIVNLRQFKPHVVACEAAYLDSKFFTGYRSLNEDITASKLAVKTYNMVVPFMEFEASAVKKTVGAKGGDKDLIKAGLLKVTNIQWEKEYEVRGVRIPFDKWYDSLDQHARDSIAIGYHCGMVIFKDKRE